MIKKENITDQAKALRQKAEQVLSKKTGGVAGSDVSAELYQLIHELEVYQVELEMQAQELWIAQAKEKSALERLSNLYEFSSTGYFTLEQNGRIGEVNPAGAKLLGIERTHLQQRYFWTLVSNDSREVFNNFFYELMEHPGGKTCEVSLINHEGALVFVEIEGIRSLDREVSHLAVRDITRQHKIQEALKAKVKEVEQLTGMLQKKDQQIKELRGLAD